MKKPVLFLVAVLIATPAWGVVLIGNNPSVSNGGCTDLSAWTKVGGGSSARVDNDHAVVPDDGGDWAVGGSDGSGSSPGYDNYYYQSFAPPEGPGVYDISLSGYSKAWAGWWSGENWGWLQEAHLELLIDGSMVFDGAAKNQAGLWDTWLLHTYAGQHTVNSSIEVRLHSIKGNDNNGAGGLGAIFFDSRYDDIMLDVVPEPATALCMLMGLPLFLRRSRRS